MDDQDKKVGRNDPCPCGSGEKYKNCHYGQETKKTFTPDGKRKFKATVLSATDKSRAIFQGTPAAPAMPKDVKPLDYLKFRKAKKDYQKAEAMEPDFVPETTQEEPTQVSQEPGQMPQLPDEFKLVDKDYRKDK